jgi:hypothetical protein
MRLFEPLNELNELKPGQPVCLARHQRLRLVFSLGKRVSFSLRLASFSEKVPIYSFSLNEAFLRLDSAGS